MNKLAVLSYCSQTAFLSGLFQGKFITEKTVLALMDRDGQDGDIADIREGLESLKSLGYLELLKEDSDEVVYRVSDIID